MIELSIHVRDTNIDFEVSDDVLQCKINTDVWLFVVLYCKSKILFIECVTLANR